ncbi:hypothetical protein ACFMQL_20295 [Nonomuraea fastidiosa]
MSRRRRDRPDLWALGTLLLLVLLTAAIVLMSVSPTFLEIQ